MRTPRLLSNLRAGAAARSWLLMGSGGILCLVLLLWLLSGSFYRSERSYAIYAYVLQPRALHLIHAAEAGEDLREALGRYVPSSWETDSEFLAMYEPPEVAISLDKTKVIVTARSNRTGVPRGYPEVFVLEMSFVDRHYASCVIGARWR